MALEPKDIAQAEALRSTYEQRLTIRERQKARKGDDIEPFVEMEIEELKDKIAQINEMLEPPPEDELQRLVEKHTRDNMRFLFVQGVKTNRRLADVETKVTRIDTTQHEATKWRLVNGPIIEALAERANREDKDAPKGRRITRIFLVFISAMLIVLVAAFIVFALQVRG